MHRSGRLCPSEDRPWEASKVTGSCFSSWSIQSSFGSFFCFTSSWCDFDRMGLKLCHHRAWTTGQSNSNWKVSDQSLHGPMASPGIPTQHRDPDRIPRPKEEERWNRRPGDIRLENNNIKNKNKNSWTSTSWTRRTRTITSSGFHTNKHGITIISRIDAKAVLCFICLFFFLCLCRSFLQESGAEPFHHGVHVQLFGLSRVTGATGVTGPAPLVGTGVMSSHLGRLDHLLSAKLTWSQRDVTSKWTLQFCDVFAVHIVLRQLSCGSWRNSISLNTETNITIWLTAAKFQGIRPNIFFQGRMDCPAAKAVLIYLRMLGCWLLVLNLVMDNAPESGTAFSLIHLGDLGS